MKNTKRTLILCGLVALLIAIIRFVVVIAQNQASAYLPLIIKHEQPTVTPTPTSIPQGVQILPNHSSYVNSIGNLHIVGEVINNTADHIRYVEIIINIYDSNGKLLDTDFTYSALENLPASEKTCFDLIVKEPPGWAYYQFEPPTYMTGGQPVTNLAILNDSGSYNSNLERYRIIGEVRNDSGNRVEYVSPIGTVYNASGTVLGCDFTYVNSTHLDPGQISSFDMTFSDRDYSGVTSYRLQVDGDTP